MHPDQPARQAGSQRQVDLIAENAKYTEDSFPPGSNSVYSAYSAVYLLPGCRISGSFLAMIASLQPTPLPLKIGASWLQ
jgi:hypothetical protein